MNTIGIPVMRAQNCFLGAALLALAMLCGPIGVAHAVPTFELTNSNVSQIDASDDKILVTVGVDGGNTTVQIQWIAGAPDTVGAIGFQQFYYDCSKTAESCNFSPNPGPETSPGHIVSVDMGGFSANFGGFTADGFGNFASRGTNFSGGTNLNLTFTLAGLEGSDFDRIGGNYPTNPDEYWWMAVQVRYANGCSAWFSNRTTSSADSDPNCVAAPEPSSVALLGIALFGLAGVAAWRRRRTLLLRR